MSISNSCSPALNFQLVAKCSTTKARACLMTLPHCKDIRLPIFMPVGTQGTLKGLTPDQLYDLDCQLILGNTYHLGHRPGPKVFENIGGLHNFMKWDRALLTDSGGFQMVSLCELSKVTEEGVEFISPHNKSVMLLTPEKSIELQNRIGADIIMQLDDVISSTLEDDKRIEEAMYRSIRWLDRCIKANANKETQNLFPIIQEMIKRDAPGYAIGGLSGGESKDTFWKIVSLCTDKLPRNKPRYCMGVGYAEDLVVCVALGVDMFDCGKIVNLVFPTRTARFGFALTMDGPLVIKKKQYANDMSPIEKECDCYTCQNYTKSFLCSIATKETIGCQLLTIHNVAFQLRLMKKMQESIKLDRFPNFVREFMYNYYSKQKFTEYPLWITKALDSVSVELKPLN